MEDTALRKIILVLGVLILAGGGGYAYYRYTRKAPAPTITTAKVSRGDIAETVGATGTLQAVTTVQVGTQVSGTILELNADFNSLVHKGQVLARLDPSLFQTQIEQSKANLIRAQADLERLRVASDDARTKLRRAQELSAKKLIAQTELEAAEVNVRSADAQLRSQQAAVTQAQASLSQSEVNQQHTIIEAPIDGLVIARNVDVGQTVAASMSAPTLFLLAADLTKMQVIASLDESDVGRIRPGQLVQFRVDAYPNDTFRGTVTQVRLQPQTVQNVVTYSTVIDVPNLELKLKPGMTANVNIEIARRNNVLRVPNAALRFRPTNEIFAALGQTPPPAPAGGRGGRRGGSDAPGGTSTPPDTRMTPPATLPATPAAAPRAQPAAPSKPPATVASTDQEPSATEGTRRGGGRGAGAGAGTGGEAGADAGSGTGGFGGGRGGGRGEDFQARMLARMAGMSPEEREQTLERMRARGFAPPADGQPAPVAQRGQTRAASAQPRQTGQAAPSATTIDALFGPLPPTESFGQVWLHENGKLNRIRLRLGITDGQQSELAQVLDNGKLDDDTEVVTAVTTAAQQTTAATGGNAFPGLGQQRGGFPGGGFPGGGFQGGGGGRGGR
ncbi:MAG: efflux RND transporter periplasmic adaptor subunit [Vicinamibacterales bacterium]|nr:efflux RND transporter periplasmic adaptor subunit [Vicinamibacterales bacterium]